MTLDSWLVARLARELDGLVAGGRVSELQGSERRLTLTCYRRREQLLLQAVFNPEQPLVAATRDDDRANESGPLGWLGGVAPLLRGSVVDAVRAVPDDRILNVDLSSRSPFGVPARHRLVLELEPRRSNALVLRPVGDEWSVLAAARQFEGAAGARDVAVGRRYEPPPARTAKLDLPGFVTGVHAALAGAEPELRGVARLLSDFDLACTPPLARSVVQSVFAVGTPAAPVERLLEAWSVLRAQVERASADMGELYVYRRGDEIVACHLVPLAWPAGDVSRAPSLNELGAQQIARSDRVRAAPAGIALRKKLERMLARCDDEEAALHAAQERARVADALRVSGDAIYANLADVPERANAFVTADGSRIALDPTLSAKQNAAAYFKRYRKARSGLPRIDARLERLAANRRLWEQLLWELERADADPSLRTAIYEDVSAALGTKRARSVSKSRTRVKERAAATARKATTTVELPGGAIAHVGRSPKDNERVTFTVARPDDYWFHARGIPGAHVVLKLAHAGETPTGEQIERAAALAAGASRASGAAKVEVDYTQRKHVRRQGKGATGLVWYTDFKTVLVTPKGH